MKGSFICPIELILKAIVRLLQNVYLCIEMSSKGLISRMSDECLMTQEMVISFYVVYQAVMRKFTLADKASRTRGSHNHPSLKSDKELQLEWSCS